MVESARVFETTDTHTAGEPTRIVTAGIDWSGVRDSICAYRDEFVREYDWVRELLMLEPRGHADMFGAVPVLDVGDDADVGVFFMDTKGYLDMCVHGTIGVVTALIETGQLAEKPDGIRVATPAGIVQTEPTVIDGRVASVSVENVASCLCERLTVDIDPYGAVSVDVVFAGNCFALVNAATLGLDTTDPDTGSFVAAGLAIRDAVNTAVSIKHPITGSNMEVELTELYWSANGVNRNITVFGNGMIDRSPCGTGTCAKMALLYASGELNVGETYRHESVIGTEFVGEIRDTTKTNERTLIIPSITGSAFITGTHRFRLNPTDPITGFTLPPGAGQDR